MDTLERTTGEILPTGYPKEIVVAIARVMGSDLYVQKRGKNQFHGYKYATVGDLLDKLQPLMAEAGLVILQNEMSTDFVDGGNVMMTRYQFTLAHISGAVWPDRPVHTGMSGCRNTKGGFDDKAANKCHTAARKYFLIGLFQVPTGEDFREKVHDGDADANVFLHNGWSRDEGVKPRIVAPDPARARPKSRDRYAEFFDRKSYEIDRKIVDDPERWAAWFRVLLEQCRTLDELAKLENDNAAHHAAFVADADPEAVDALGRFQIAQAQRLQVGLQN